MEISIYNSIEQETQGKINQPEVNQPAMKEAQMVSGENNSGSKVLMTHPK